MDTQDVENEPASGRSGRSEARDDWVGLSSCLGCRYSGDIECIISHAVPLNLIIIYIFLLLTVFFFVYISYTIILIKFCKRKRRLQRGLAQRRLSGRPGERNISSGTSTPTRPAPARPGQSQTLGRRLLGQLPGLSHQVSELLKSMRAAKYILTTMSALSLTWLPWLLTLSTDIYTHTVGHQQQQLATLDQVPPSSSPLPLIDMIGWRVSSSAVSMICSTASGLARQTVSSVPSGSITTAWTFTMLFMLTIKYV